MHSLLTRLLQKRGVPGPEKLDQEERKDFDRWQAVLSKRELGIEEIKEFCATQVKIIEMKWRDYESSQEKKNSLIPYHCVYKTLLEAIGAPEVERQAMEAYLNQLTQ